MRPIICLSMVFLMITSCGNNEEDPAAQQDGLDPAWIIFSKENSKLPDNQVNALTIDASDTKWIGTADGLVRISKTGWTIFTIHNSLLPSNHITALATESDGTVWVGTDQGLAKFDGGHWSVYTCENSALTNNHITCLTHDLKNGTTWIGTDEGLVKVDKHDGFQHISVADNTILSITTDQDGALWIGFFKSFAFVGQISKYMDGRWQHHNLRQLGFPSALPYGLAVDKNNAVLAVLAGTSVKTVIKNSGRSWDEVTGPDGARGLRAILLEDDKIWIGGNSLSTFGSKNAECLSIPGQETHIRTMALDSKGRKWLGTLTEGLAVYQSLQ